MHASSRPSVAICIERAWLSSFEYATGFHTFWTGWLSGFLSSVSFLFPPSVSDPSPAWMTNRGEVSQCLRGIRPEDAHRPSACDKLLPSSSKLSRMRWFGKAVRTDELFMGFFKRFFLLSAGWWKDLSIVRYQETFHFLHKLSRPSKWKKSLFKSLNSFMMRMRCKIIISIMEVLTAFPFYYLYSKNKNVPTKVLRILLPDASLIANLHCKINPRRFPRQNPTVTIVFFLRCLVVFHSLNPFSTVHCYPHFHQPPSPQHLARGILGFGRSFLARFAFIFAAVAVWQKDASATVPIFFFTTPKKGTRQWDKKWRTGAVA